MLKLKIDKVTVIRVSKSRFLANLPCSRSTQVQYGTLDTYVIKGYQQLLVSLESRFVIELLLLRWTLI